MNATAPIMSMDRPGNSSTKYVAGLDFAQLEWQYFAALRNGTPPPDLSGILVVDEVKLRSMMSKLYTENRVQADAYLRGLAFSEAMTLEDRKRAFAQHRFEESKAQLQHLMQRSFRELRLARYEDAVYRWHESIAESMRKLFNSMMVLDYPHPMQLEYLDTYERARYLLMARDYHAYADRSLFSRP